VSAFLDTNVLIYAQQTGEKPDRARALLAQGGRLSVQVLNEFAVVARRKQGKNWDDIAAAIEDVLMLVDPPLPLTLDLHSAARTLAQDHQLSFYDALIIAAALEAGCETLWSEDLQHGRVIGGMTIRNPFAGPVGGQEPF
jgi:predicted nucleic acid-binding protein